MNYPVKKLNLFGKDILVSILQSDAFGEKGQNYLHTLILAKRLSIKNVLFISKPFLKRYLPLDMTEKNINYYAPQYLLNFCFFLIWKVYRIITFLNLYIKQKFYNSILFIVVPYYNYLKSSGQSKKSKLYIYYRKHIGSYIKQHNPTGKISKYLDQEFINLTGQYFGSRLRYSLKTMKVEIQFSKKQKNIIDKQLLYLGIKNSDEIIIFHARSDDAKNKNDFFDTARNVSEKNYIPTIRYFLSLGYKIVIVGNSKSFSYQSENVIDLCKVQNYKQLLEWYFHKRAILFIGCDSGPLIASMICNTPALTTNAVDVFASFPIRENCRMIFKSFKDRNNKNIKFNKISEFCRDRKILEEFCYNNLLFINENTSDEILLASKEMLIMIKKDDFTLSNKQKIVKNLLNEKAKEVSKFVENDNFTFLGAGSISNSIMKYRFNKISKNDIF